MAVELVRKNSDTPNIQNYDDARMFRYATYGLSGYVPNFRQEVAFSQNGSNTLHIGSGEIVHQGWQVLLDSLGYDLELDNRDYEEYYTIYVEISLTILSNQTAKILSMKGNIEYPTIDAGDDLTQNPSGTSRLPICHVYLKPSDSTFTITSLLKPIIEIKEAFDIEGNNYIGKESKVARIANYASADTSKGTIEERLTRLGFKTGGATTSGIIVNQYTYRSNSVRKIGKYVLFSFVIGTDQYPAWTQAMASQAHTITVPEWARPKSTTSLTYQIREHIRASFDNGEVAEWTMGIAYVSYETTINTSGVINITCGGDRVTAWGSDVRVTSQFQYPAGGIVIYCGWETN